ncbi:S-layer homology domain-containing protein [Lysinibacillus xylanilyticus]|uniref:S-layer homology domain-containing protein n=1 Tax=Lysinibacillus xylanilyticus TaxID=582475 RepID=UPI002B251624|nr:S-layer homology domain-containing protein [Lysinibacillus xylanilyticus]MEB2280025.1 S-layer homology domain-containing protein [Lysinibacillus xylanilyticus]
MANQPKKYKKFVATAATATLVASAIVPVASAASFTDVTDTNSHKDAISSLVDAGIIKGYPDGTFKPDQFVSRGQVVKLLGRWLETEGYEIPADWNTKQRFNDLPVTTADKELVQYAALAKEAGAFNGANGNLNYSQNMARQQMAIVLVRAIKEIKDVDLVKEYKDAKFTSEISDLGGLNTEQREAITALEYAELTKAATLPGKAFKPNDTITRAQFASFLDRTMKLEVTAPAKAAVKAINSTTVEVTFEEEVENVQALNFEIKDLEVKNAAVKQTNKKVVVLTTAPQTADKEYTVSLGGEEIGKFKGISAVVPTKVDIVSKSEQGKLGQQVTVKAKVTVAEGQSKAGIPVTFNVPGNNNDAVNPTLTGEAVTNDEGIATYSYTRYAAKTDTVTAYATGDRSKFSIGYVFWGVDTILTVKDVNEGSAVNNGANKTYKVAFKNAVTGKAEANKTFNVSVLENIDVTADKLQNVTVNGTPVAQLSNGTVVKAAQITTDGNGEATFTVSGTNAEVTPVVYEAAPVYDANNKVTSYSSKYDASALQASAAKVKFGALQAEYTIDLKRDGGEVAAIGDTNGGRKYNIVVKDKDGKVAKNEIVNVAFNEDIDGVIATNTKAKFIKVDAEGNQSFYGDAVDKDGNKAKQIVVKTNDKGEASFVIGSSDVNDYATPVAWIDINTSNAADGKLDKGEPTAVGAIAYFQEQYLDGAKITSYDATNKKVDKFKDKEEATFKPSLTNQSGKTYNATAVTFTSVTYTVTNTGANDIEVQDIADGKWKVVSPNRNFTTSTTTTSTTTDLKVRSVDGKTTSVKVLATGNAKYTERNSTTEKTYAFTSKEATAAFTKTSEVGNTYTGIVKSINTDKEELVINDKEAVKYAGESGKTYVYKGLGGATISDADAFIDIIKNAEVTVTRTVDGNTVTFTIVNINNNGTKPVDTAAAEKAEAVNALADAIKAEETAALKAADYTKESFDAYKAALDAAKAVDVAKASTKDIQKATNALADAKKALKPSETATADKEAAKKALDDAIKAVKPEDYKSPAAAKAFVKAATEVLDNPASTKADYEKAKAELEANLGTLEKVAVLVDAVAPTATAAVDVAGKVVTVTFNSNVTITDGQTINVDTKVGTVAKVETAATTTTITFEDAPTADGEGTITVKTPANATTKEGNFTYNVKFDAATKEWTVTLK